MDVDDAARECLDQRRRMHAVVARVHHQLDPLKVEEITHRNIAGFGAFETLLRELAQRKPVITCERGAATRCLVGRDRDDLEPAFDQVAQVRALTGDADSQSQRISTRSGPLWWTTSPTTDASFGTSAGSTARIIPSPMLKVAHISSSETRPSLRIVSKMAGTSHVDPSRRAPSPSGRQRGRLPRMPPPVMCAAPFQRMRWRSARYEVWGASMAFSCASVGFLV